MKIQKEKIKTWIALILFFFIGLTFVVEAILMTVCIEDLQDGEGKTYQGNYEVTRKDLLRNTRYVFTLSNGDTISVDGEQLANKDMLLETDFELKFLYSSHKSLFSMCYRGVSIASIDESMIFVQESAVKAEISGAAVTYFVIGFPTVLFAVLLILCQLPLFSYLSLIKRRFRKHRTLLAKTCSRMTKKHAKTKPK